MKNCENYYLGLDIGTESIGYAVTGEDYTPLKHGGENMLGTHVFSEPNEAAERRGFRTARRRLDRRQQRVKLVQEIFAPEIAKVDENFFIRIKESALWREDRTNPKEANTYFTEKDFDDKAYYKKYPTIHHLLCALMNDTEAHNVREVYIACAYLVAHRGHFLIDADKDNIDVVLDFNKVYKEFSDFFKEREISLPWNCESGKIAEILKKRVGITAKEKELTTLLFGGKVPKEDEYPYARKQMVKLLAGGTVTKIKDLFLNDAYEEMGKVSLSCNEEDFESVISELEDDDAELLILMRKLYDWSTLSDIVGDFASLSEGKVNVYETHNRDLNNLKDFVKKYLPEKYDEIFRAADSKLNNYTAYSNNFRWVKDAEAKELPGKITCEDFCKYLRKIVSGVKVKAADAKFYDNMMARIESNSFMPKQVDGANRVIPYQLYYTELKAILKKAEVYLPFLTEKDEDNLTASEKILSVFLFKVPYYVGPMRRDNSQFAWIERKAEGKIYPWNFTEKVDCDRSEQSFIDRMTCRCTYLAGESVLPKNSLLYSKYVVLNEINTIKINDKLIPVEVKQELYTELFEKHARVTPKSIKNYLVSNGYMTERDEMSGLDVTVKASLASYHAFKKLLDAGVLSEGDVERIIERKAYTEDKARLEKWLKDEYPQLEKNDVKYIVGLKLKDFGRMSKKLLCGVVGCDKETGEEYTVIEALWKTQKNLMQLIATDDFTFKEQIEEECKEYYAANPRSLTDRLDEMYVSGAVRRSIIRTLDIAKEIRKIKGEPKKIFIEMTRGTIEDQKGKRTKSRRDIIKDFYTSFPIDETRELLQQLESKDDRQLQSKRLFLYFMQLGKCMYSGEAINIEKLNTKRYDIDHIYPQSLVKDDSIDNTVLVLSTINGEKGDNYPIKENIRKARTPFWEMLHKQGLVSDKKLARLTRSTPFDENEKWGFINRQLTETSQATKAVATLLKELFPDSEIVYVKAGLVSEFRHEFELPKSRTVNDLHHAKDAYLNIVVGNVYNSYFSRMNRAFNINKYTVNTKKLFNRELKFGDRVLWRGEEDLERVKRIMANDHIHYTIYPICKKGELFKQQPLKVGAANDLVPRKKGLDVTKYGGYTKTAASYFVLVKYDTKKGSDVIFMPVQLLFAKKFEADKEFAMQYSKEVIGEIVNDEVKSVEFPLGMRKIKINTVISLDGFLAYIRGKANGGARVLLSSINPLRVGKEAEQYICRLESFDKKQKKAKEQNKNAAINISEEHDKITREQNIRLYDVYREKLNNKPFSICFGNIACIVEKGRERFLALSTEEQVECLLHIGEALKTGRSGGCDMTLLGGKERAGEFYTSTRLSNIAKTYSDLRIIDVSAAGLYVKRSENLLDLL